MKSRVRLLYPVLLAACLLTAAAPASVASDGALRAMSDNIADVVDKVMPSVVVVRTEAIRYRVYRDIFFGTLHGIPQRLAGQGSGVIIDQHGYILTSNHVISDAEEVEVVLHDGTIFEAELVGEDRYTDLAVLKIKDPGDYELTAVEPGDSDALRVGEIVVAVGSPFSLSSSVTLGIVSQKGRSVGLLPFEDFIQTDASINPGNSGGPLVDVDGRMVGINAVIQTAGPRGSIGIGFAVPGNRAMAIAQDLIEDGAVNRPWLGINPAELAPNAARRVLGQESGVYVAEVFSGTPASRGGLYEGDIILEVNGEPVASIIELQRAVFDQEIGTDIEMTILRSNRRITVTISSEPMPAASMFSR